ncbi:MAG: Cd(II)/Pb(II)-responsive transcriptional regulator [Halothiobacillus sp.]
MNATYRIGELAIRCGVERETIRYYEKIGLLPEPQRQANGYRAYGEAHIEQLAFIRHCRALDIPLADIQKLQQFSNQPSADCSDIDQLIETQLARVHERLISLHNLEKQLLSLRATCASGRRVQECGILHELVAAARGDACHADESSLIDQLPQSVSQRAPA